MNRQVISWYMEGEQFEGLEMSELFCARLLQLHEECGAEEEEVKNFLQRNPSTEISFGGGEEENKEIQITLFIQYSNHCIQLLCFFADFPTKFLLKQLLDAVQLFATPHNACVCHV